MQRSRESDEGRRQSTLGWGRSGDLPPLVSIVEATLESAASRGYRKVALFGTRFTMEGGLYARAFAARGLEVVVPGDDERTFIHDT